MFNIHVCLFKDYGLSLRSNNRYKALFKSDVRILCLKLNELKLNKINNG